MKKPTMAWIKARCDEDGDCLIWNLSTNKNGTPVATVRQPDGKKLHVQMRRATWELRSGPIPDGMCVTYACTNPRCLEHLALATRGDVVRREWTRPDKRARLVAGLIRAGRPRAKKLDMEKARYIRTSELTLQEVAAEMGVSFQLASKIRRGERWRESNPFAGLGG